MKYVLLLAVVAMCIPGSQAKADDKTEWELWLPPSGRTVTAVFVAPRWGDGANMVKLIQDNLGEKLGVATMLTREDKLTFKEPHFVPSIGNTLTTSAAALKRPELANAPLLLWSHSNSAAYIQQSLKDMPQRIIAYCLFKSAFGHNNDLGTGKALGTEAYGYVSPDGDDNNRGRMSIAATQVLGQSIWDKNDRINSPGYNQEHERKAMFKNIADARKQGALVHVTIVQGTHHVIDGQQPLMLAFFETAMAMRIPPGADPAKGPVKLVGGLENKGALQDWSERKIYPYAAYPAGKTKREAWWLPSWEYAELWNGYALNAKGAMIDPDKLR